MQRFNSKTLNEMEFRVQYKLHVPNKFTHFENVDDCGDILVHRVRERIGENIKTSGKILV
jgi:hypothetical protein